MALFSAAVNVMLKPGIADVQGKTIERALPALGYDQVDNVQVGKRFVVSIEAQTAEEARTLAGEMCDRLLANPVIESYEVEVT